MKKICVVCKKDFEVYPRETSHSRGARWVGKRPHRCITCSKNCSVIYAHRKKPKRK